MLSKARLLGLAWGLFGASMVWGQSVGGSIQGTVRDAGGAVLAGAEVAVRSVGTRGVRTGHRLRRALPGSASPSGRVRGPLLARGLRPRRAAGRPPRRRPGR